VNGTPIQDPPETVEIIFVWDKRLAFPATRVSSARSCPMPEVIAREPPPLKHTATLPGVSLVMNEPTASGGVSVKSALNVFPDAIINPPRGCGVFYLQFRNYF